MGSRNARHVRLVWRRYYRDETCIAVRKILFQPQSGRTWGSPGQFGKRDLSFQSSTSLAMNSESSEAMCEGAKSEKDHKPFGPVIMKLDTPQFHSLFTPGLKKIQELFSRNGFEISIAGGAVRDLLVGIKPKDIDFATTATPPQMIEMFEKEEYRMYNENGHSHGTVTCRVCEESFEITTLRIDRVTDGRHAQVEFTKDWFVDASRRDLTINSMFLDLHGNIIDFFNGKEDLMNQRVRFVGNATKRIDEDYLRILRFFRFYGRIADHDSEFDQEAIAAIKARGQGLLGISGPRIWSEMTQIFHGHFVVRIMKKMHECGLMPYIGFPEEVDTDLFEKIYKKIKHLDRNHMTYVSTLLKTEEDVLELDRRLQITKNERKTALFIIAHRDQINPADPGRLKFCKDILVDIPAHEGCHKSYVIEVLKYIGDLETIMLLQEWKIPKFPVSGRMLMEAGVPKGKSIGEVRNILKQKWKESHYLLSPEELLKDVPEILENFSEIIS